MNAICSPLGYFKCLPGSQITAYYKAKLSKGCEEEPKRKKQRQDASPSSSDNQAKTRVAKAPVFLPFRGPIDIPQSPVLLWMAGGGGEVGMGVEGRVGMCRSSTEENELEPAWWLCLMHVRGRLTSEET